MTETNPTARAAESPSEVRSAADALKRAKAELEKAQAYYENVRQQAIERREGRAPDQRRRRDRRHARRGPAPSRRRA